MTTVTLPPEVTDHLGLRELESGEGSGGKVEVKKKEPMELCARSKVE